MQQNLHTHTREKKVKTIQKLTNSFSNRQASLQHITHTHNFYTVWRTTTMDRTIHMHPFLCRLLEQANNECFHSSTTNTHA